MTDAHPTVIVLAGPNGAGKTTASRALLADTLGVMNFVNADVIAQGLAGFDPDSTAIEAGRIMLERLHDLTSRRVDFAFETTLAARSPAGWLEGLREDGYEVKLFYFWLQTEELAVARVAQRVRLGGHDIPEETIRRRHAGSARNFFHLYRPIVSAWKVFDNSSEEEYRLIAEGTRGEAEAVVDPAIWEIFQQRGKA
jgi:predicted ABC-type ATPase